MRHGKNREDDRKTTSRPAFVFTFYRPRVFLEQTYEIYGTRLGAGMSPKANAYRLRLKAEFTRLSGLGLRQVRISFSP